MIVWGGAGALNTGGSYDPATDTWTVTSTVGAPSGRRQHTAVWTGSKMIVWGGAYTSDTNFDTGAIYQPATDTWIATSTVGAPSARVVHTAVWSGTEMIVWGGFRSGASVNTGAIYLPGPPQPLIVPSGATLLAEGCGSGNGAIDPGERVTVNFALGNLGHADTTNLVATLLESGGVTSPTGPQGYGVVIAGGSPVTRPFSFTAAGTCGETLTATLRLQDGTTDLGTVGFDLRLGIQLPGEPSTLSNPTVITVISSGRATPYPSSISVSVAPGSITKVTATLRSIHYSWPDDLDILLVGPAGQTVVLMSDAGANAVLSGVTLTFDDDAASGLPDGLFFGSGTFRPTNWEGADTFASPAPSGPYGATLSVFNGTNPNGTWKLFVFDDEDLGDGTIAGGWSLTITSTTPLCCTPPPPGITVSPTSGLLTTEAGGSGTFTVVLNSIPTADVTIPLSSSDMTEGTVSPASLTFSPANALTAQTVTVTGVDDTVVDGNVAYMIVTGAATSADTGYNGLNPPDVSVTNTDNDVAGITVSPTSGLLTTEAGGADSFTVVLRSTPTANVTIPLSSSDTTEGTVSAAFLTFTPGNALAPQAVTVTGVDDAVVDGPIAYTIVTAPAVSSDPMYGGRDAADVSVRNDDDDTSSLSVGDATVTEGNSGTVDAVFMVTLAPANAQTVTVDFATTDDTATAPSDYLAGSGTLTFAPGETTLQVTVTVNGDTEVEPSETFFVNLSNPTNAVIADGQAVGAITNDDLPAVSIDDVTVTEGGTATFTVSLSQPSPQTVDVEYATADGSAIAGSDYTQSSGTVTFPPGTVTQSLTVAVLEDTTAEPSEAFFVNLSNPINATTGDGQGQATVVDDDGLSFYTISPCRLIDTRDPDGPLGGPALIAGTDRVFTIVDNCDVPPTAKAVSVNLAVTSPTAAGNLRLYPAGTPRPLVSTINYSAGQTRANNGIVPLSAAGEIAVYCAQASGTTHFILDVNGYFE
jgi:hypothetical protein